MTNMNSTVIRVLILDEENFVHKLLKTYMANDPDIQLVSSSNGNQSSIAAVESLKPDVAILDVKLEDSDHFETAQVITQRFPETKVLLLSSNEDSEHVRRAIQAGARGYLNPASPPLEIIDAIHYIHKGFLQLGPGLLEQVLQNNTLQSNNQAADLTSNSQTLQQPSKSEIENRGPLKLDVLRYEQQFSILMERINKLQTAMLVLWLTLVVVAVLIVLNILNIFSFR